MTARFVLSGHPGLRGARLLSSASSKYVRLASLPDRYIDECVGEQLTRAGCANIHLFGTWHMSNGVEGRMRACIDRLPKLALICAESKISPAEFRQMSKLGKLAGRERQNSPQAMRQLGYDDKTAKELLLYGEINGADFRAATKLAKTAGTWPTPSIRVVNIDQYRRLFPRDVVKKMEAQWKEAMSEDVDAWLHELNATDPDLLGEFIELQAQKQAEIECLNQTFSEPLLNIHNEGFRIAALWMNRGSPEFEAVRYQASAESSDKTPFAVIRDLCMTACLRNEAMRIGEGRNILGVVGAAHRPRIRRFWSELSDADVESITELYAKSGGTQSAWSASGALVVLERTIAKELECDIGVVAASNFKLTVRSSVPKLERWEVRSLLAALEEEESTAGTVEAIQDDDAVGGCGRRRARRARRGRGRLSSRGGSRENR